MSVYPSMSLHTWRGGAPARSSGGGGGTQPGPVGHEIITAWVQQPLREHFAGGFFFCFPRDSVESTEYISILEKLEHALQK